MSEHPGLLIHCELGARILWLIDEIVNCCFVWGLWRVPPWPERHGPAVVLVDDREDRRGRYEAKVPAVTNEEKAAILGRNDGQGADVRSL